MENQNGMAFIQSAQQIVVPPQQVNQGGDLEMKILPNPIPASGEENQA